MASIEKRGVSYRITASCGYTSDGKKIRRYMTWTPELGMTKKQIERELQRQSVLFEEKVKSGQFLDGNIKLCDFAEKWMTEYSEKQHKAQTVASNLDAIRRINETLGHISIGKLQPHHILEFINRLGETGQNRRTGGTLATKTISNYFRVLSSILSTAVQWGVITDNPTKRVKPPKVRRREAKSLDDTQTIRLLEALENEPIKYRVAMKMLIFTGARRGELLGLTWDDINMEKCTVNVDKAVLYLPDRGVYKDTPKNEASNRVIKIPQSVIEDLCSYKSEQNKQRLEADEKWPDESYIFTKLNGQPLHPDTLTQWCGEFIKRINSKIDKREDLTAEEKESLKLPYISPHSLRHTNASLLIASGVNIRTVAARLGHAQTSTTTNIYSHAIKTADALASDALDAVLIRQSV